MGKQREREREGETKGRKFLSGGQSPLRNTRNNRVVVRQERERERDVEAAAMFMQRRERADVH